MTTAPTVIGRCSVCMATAVLLEGGCARCVARYGPGFVRAAARVRTDPRFRALVVTALDPSLRRCFEAYFGADPTRLPSRIRRGDFDSG